MALNNEKNENLKNYMENINEKLELRKNLLELHMAKYEGRKDQRERIKKDLELIEQYEAELENCRLYLEKN